MSVSLSAKGEAEWRRVKTHLELSEGFCLCFMFSGHAAAASLFRDRLADILRMRVTKLKLYEPATPEELADKILPRILQPYRFEEDTKAPVWLDLAAQTGAEWAEARVNLLARLNEQREPLRKRLLRPLILVLPLAEKPQIRGLVPDLWSIRSFALEIDDSLVETPPPARDAPAAPPDPEPLPLSEADRAAVAEWNRVREKRTRDRGILLAGGRAFDALYRARRLREALQTAEEVLAISRRILASVGETPEALRDLSVSLDNVGKTDLSLGQYEDARKVFTEGLEIGARLAEAFPQQVEYNSLKGHFEERLRELEDGRETPSPG